jgi:SAM-dependent methyltransferase
VETERVMKIARAALRCPRCGREMELNIMNAAVVCRCGNTLRVENRLIEYTGAESLRELSEVKARDWQAPRYLQHAKFPTQIFRVKQFLKGLPQWVKEKPVIELGCGPGPYTRILLDSFYDVIAVDFSEQSLLINRDANCAHLENVCYVKADLNALRMSSECSALLVMCDFLQHLGGYAMRAAFIHKAFDWLAPGGFFYLTFFNFNIVNYLKGDLHGHFADGAIAYERLLHREVSSTLPANVSVDSVVPLNIFHSVVPDRVAAMLPGATFLSRMIAISGRKARGAMEPLTDART